MKINPSLDKRDICSMELKSNKMWMKIDFEVTTPEVQLREAIYAE